MSNKKPYRYKRISVRNRKIDEHRYVMEQHLGRYLQSWEVVKHKDKNPLNNELSNLYVVHRKMATVLQYVEGDLKTPNDLARKNSKITTIREQGQRCMIIDFKTGEELMILPSVRYAARTIRCSYGNAGDVVNGRKKQTHGFVLKKMPNEPNAQECDASGMP